MTSRLLGRQAPEPCALISSVIRIRTPLLAVRTDGREPDRSLSVAAPRACKNLLSHKRLGLVEPIVIAVERSETLSTQASEPTDDLLVAEHGLIRPLTPADAD